MKRITFFFFQIVFTALLIVPCTHAGDPQIANQPDGNHNALIAQAAQLFQQDVFTGGTDGYHTYRIPALLVTKKGSLLAFCEGRKTGGGDHGDIDLVVKRSIDAGKTWSEQNVVYEEGGTDKITIGNPCPVVDGATGRIWLTFCRNNDDVLVTFSDDDGLTWSEPRLITASVKKEGWGWYATGPGVGIQKQREPHKGRLVIPCDHREQVDGKWIKMSHAFYSDDGGENWTLGGTVGKYTDECQVVEQADGNLMMNMRNYWGSEGGDESKGGKRAVSISRDGGETWGGLSFDERLVEPICQASILRYSWPENGKSRVLFSNPASSSNRVHMTVRMSYDEGETWLIERELYDGSSAYSCLAALPDGRIACLYERDGYSRITLAIFTLQWLAPASEVETGVDLNRG
ncbi:MAG: exo-alpha-sialidase [bacterium]|nr:exo-alpha-sialidase [bacterium]